LSLLKSLNMLNLLNLFNLKFQSIHKFILLSPQFSPHTIHILLQHISILTLV